jgi:hypothetical protein
MRIVKGRDPRPLAGGDYRATHELG